MNPRDITKPGLYRVFYRDAHSILGDGRRSHSLAAIGVSPDGRPWLAPTNWVAPNARPHANTLNNGTVNNLWDTIDHVELIEVCDSPEQCTLRKALLDTAKPAIERIALADQLKETSLETLRDLLLAGRDVEALGVLTTELGMRQVASGRPVLRALKVGDPVVVVAYGRIVDKTTGHGACYNVSLFSEGLGYATSTTTRNAWFEADEIQYSLPPDAISGRVPV